MSLGQFVELEVNAKPWALWKIWVEYAWLDFRCPTLEAMAREILKSGWMESKLKREA